jgi:hypothetical protein
MINPQILATENKFSVSFKTKSFEDLRGKASEKEEDAWE